ncbi:unnamed protein product [Didymodactylos carnosus]|uniref:Reverse transcriptase/retrotransposon-derived protein RNase H-like domain-containing protein n=1 Tax=Didymodactylos carnosus TaxID=1234261 RepID=A0A815APH3_9BILA|nr:unnamed protein product [Didymodactylos carnosus]CAF4033657.1 unnamed protein product [Didymodactylos carnosus]
MEIVLCGLQWSTCLAYIDDILVYSKTFDEHLEHLDEIFGRIIEANLKLTPDKIKTVEEFPVPQNVDELNSFVSLVSYYRRFVKNFASIAYPLNRLRKKNVLFIWDENCRQAFQELKLKLTTAPVLRYRDFTQPFTVFTDACKQGLGGVLSQVFDGQECGIAYASQGLKDSETRCAPVEFEAIVWAIK